MPKTTKRRIQRIEDGLRRYRRTPAASTWSTVLLLDVAVSVVAETWHEPPTRHNAGAIQDAARDLVNPLM